MMQNYNKFLIYANNFLFFFNKLFIFIVRLIMDLRKYISERIDNEVKKSLYETIKPIVFNHLMEAKKNKKKINVDKLIDKLMDNKEFKDKAIKYIENEYGFKGWTNGLKGKKYSRIDNLSDGAKRRNITNRLNDKKINYAPIAYELWPDMSKDAARSWFSKKVNGKNESFTDDEVSQIYSLLNNKIN